MATILSKFRRQESYERKAGFCQSNCLNPAVAAFIIFAIFYSVAPAFSKEKSRIASNTLPLSINATINKRTGNSPKVLAWKSRNKAKATIICLHALGLSSHAYNDLGQALSEHDFEVYAMDARGFGKNRKIDGLDKLDLDRTVVDLKQLIDCLLNENPDRKIFLIGESMGGAIALKAASKYPNLIKGLMVSAPAYKLYKTKRLTLKNFGDIVTPGLGPAAKSFIRQATSSQKLRDHWLKDPDNHKLQLSFGEALSYYRFVRNTPRYSAKIKALPICIMHGLKDHLAPPQGSARLFSNIASSEKLLVIDCEAEHLLLEEKQLTNRILALSIDWLNQKLAQPKAKSYKQLLILKNNTLDVVDQEMIRDIRKKSGVRLHNANSGSMI